MFAQNSEERSKQVKSRQHRESYKQMWQTTSVENNVWMFCIISQIMQHIHQSLDVKKELRPKFKTSGTSNSHYPDISICIEWDTQCLNIPQNVSLISTLIFRYLNFAPFGFVLICQNYPMQQLTFTKTRPFFCKQNTDNVVKQDFLSDFQTLCKSS